MIEIKELTFYHRASEFLYTQTAESDVVIAYPSVYLSVTLWYCIETNAHVVNLFPPSGRGTTLVF